MTLLKWIVVSILMAILVPFYLILSGIDFIKDNVGRIKR